MKVAFRNLKLSSDNKRRLAQINSIIREYQTQGLVLTLRQLYYQLVSRDVIPNKVTEYAKLSTLLKEGRMAGVVDWDAIEDRLRQPYTPSAWDSPEDIVESIVRQYKKPRMKGQDNYLEVWVEKDALSGVLKRVTSKYHVPILVNRGYSSASAMYDSYNRFREAIDNDQKVTILYLGDYDPSGIDMIRDVFERPLEMLASMANSELQDAFDRWVGREHEGREDYAYEYLIEKYGYDFEKYRHAFYLPDDEKNKEENYEFDTVRAFIYEMFEVVPIALTLQQIRLYTPPPNPAKVTDPRSKKFIQSKGSQSWEVDALRPEVLNEILTEAIVSRIDLNKYDEILKEEIKDRATLITVKKKLPELEPDEDYLESNLGDSDEEEDDDDDE